MRILKSGKTTEYFLQIYPTFQEAVMPTPKIQHRIYLRHLAEITKHTPLKIQSKKMIRL